MSGRAGRDLAAAVAGVRRHANARGWSTTDLARAAGLNIDTVADTLRGVRRPQTKTALALERAVGWSPGTFAAVVRGEQSPPVTPMPTARMDLFWLRRDVDATGTSGTGLVAEGVIFSDGTVAMRWRTGTTSTAIYASIEDVVAIHGHGGSTRVVSALAEPGARLGEREGS